jgi:hypothetical protein
VSGERILLSRVPLDSLLAWFGEDDPAVLARAREVGQEATVLERQARHAFVQRMDATSHSCAERAAEKRASVLDLLNGDSA